MHSGFYVSGISEVDYRPEAGYLRQAAAAATEPDVVYQLLLRRNQSVTLNCYSRLPYTRRAVETHSYYLAAY